MKLADLQATFQQDILNGSAGSLALIPDSPRETKETLFGVYRNAYVIRLGDFLKHDFERLHTYLGDDHFDRLALDFIAANPSHTPNARWYGRELPEFVATYAPLAATPMATAIATLEGALNDAFDCADAAPLEQAALSRFAIDAFERLTFVPHPSARRFDTVMNLDDVWSALAEERTPPAPEQIALPQTFLVWRKDVTPRYRVLGREEAMLWDEAAKGVRFGVLCEMLATFDDPDTAALRAAQYLQSWISLGLLSGARLAPSHKQ